MKIHLDDIISLGLGNFKRNLHLSHGWHPGNPRQAEVATHEQQRWWLYSDSPHLMTHHPTNLSTTSPSLHHSFSRPASRSNLSLRSDFLLDFAWGYVFSYGRLQGKGRHSKKERRLLSLWSTWKTPQKINRQTSTNDRLSSSHLLKSESESSFSDNCLMMSDKGSSAFKGKKRRGVPCPSTWSNWLMKNPGASFRMSKIFPLPWACFLKISTNFKEPSEKANTWYLFKLTL